MSFPTYEDYKESGIEWLGKVPDHWEVHRFKRSTVSCRNGIWGSEARGDENDIKCVRVADFDRERLTICDDIPTIRNVTESERADRSLSRGNLLLEKSGGGDLQPVGFVVLYDIDELAICSNFIAKVELAEGMNPSYWRYCHAAAYSVRLNYRSIKQTSGIQNLDQSQYLDERAPFPSLAEQRAIASFLDRETSKIDGLVSEQRRLIELLKEKRQAFISHAVTKGLNPHAPLKPSGIPWLGDVPRHWDVLSVRRVSTSVQTGGTPSTVLPADDVEAGQVWYTPGDFGDSLRLTNSARMLPLDVVQSDDAKLFPAHSVLVVSIGATLGKVGFAEGVSAANQQINAVVPNEKIDGYFLAYSLSAKVEVMRFLSNASTIGIMNQEKTKEIWLVVPPMSEQREITAHLDAETAKLDALTAEAERAIELLQERRTALISAAVTGKIDVRGLACEVTP